MRKSAKSLMQVFPLERERERERGNAYDENPVTPFRFSIDPQSKKRPFGIAVGYGQKQFRIRPSDKSLPSTKTSLTGLSSNKYSHTFSIGLTWMPEFKYGIGIQTGIYYDLTMEKAKEEESHNTDTRYSSTDHSLSIPLRIQYRIELAKDFSLFIYAGPSFDIGLAFNDKVSSFLNDQETSTESRDRYKEDLKRFNLLCGVGGGIRWKGLQLRAGGDWGLLNMVKDAGSNSTYKLFINKPFTINLSYQF